MPKRSKTFGVKVTGTKGKKSFGTSSATSRTFGIKTPAIRGIPGTTGKMESCLLNCPGEYIRGMWIHSPWCKWSAVLWRAHGKTEKDWQCPFNCPPLQIASGWTHQWQCQFWEHTGRTPIDHTAPLGTVRV